ncbi:MAG: LysM peptidoglycan-binding domain-containing protein [Planctomycetes bacterium]|nr:LysM peptidoglycan-binding domain-containing protein [Planctomycetota bacterium]
MARETKLGLLVGLGVILLIGIIVSDHLSAVNKQDHADMTSFGATAQRGLQGGDMTIPPPVEPSVGTVAQAPTPDAPPPMLRPVVSLPNEPAVLPPTQPGQVSNGVTVPGPQAGLASNNLGTPTVLPPTPAATPTVTEPKPLATHTVVKGDSVYQIAKKYYRNGEKWQLIREANPGHVGSEGELQVGTQLKIPALPDATPAIPAPSKPATIVDAGSTVVEPVAPEKAPSAAHEGIPVRIIEVKAGQSLTQIAREQLGSGNRWHELLELNKDQISSAKDLKLGMKIKVPAGSTATSGNVLSTKPRVASTPSRTYTVQVGDTLGTIAAKTLGDRNKWEMIEAANKGRLNSPHDIKIGQQLVIPALASR